MVRFLRPFLPLESRLFFPTAMIALDVKGLLRWMFDGFEVEQGLAMVRQSPSPKVSY